MSKAKIKTVLDFNLYELKPETEKWLANGWYREDYRSFWLDKISLLDQIAMGDCEGISLELDDLTDEIAAVTPVPEEWWAGFADDSLRRQIEEFWKTHPTGEVTWT